MTQSLEIESQIKNPKQTQAGGDSPAMVVFGFCSLMKTEYTSPLSPNLLRP